MNARKSPIVTRIAINNALADGNVELASFYQYANTQIPEVALTEFAARLCYNSTAKLGNSPNFVRDVLSHGHLSVAEHASIAVIGSRFDVTFQKLIGVNRFFSRDRFYVAGNMRSWIEYLAVTGYSPISEVIISCFPPAFKVSEVIKEFDPEIFTFDNGFTVPGFENVDLLAVNFGNMPIINRVERRGENSWEGLPSCFQT